MWQMKKFGVSASALSNSERQFPDAPTTTSIEKGTYGRIFEANFSRLRVVTDTNFVSSPGMYLLKRSPRSLSELTNSKQLLFLTLAKGYITPFVKELTALNISDLLIAMSCKIMINVFSNPFRS